MYCLCCNEALLPEVTWGNIIFFQAPTNLCSSCHQKLYMLQGNRCIRCSRECDTEVCGDCQQWNTIYDGEDPLTYNYSIYSYNTKVKEILAQWKYRGDYQLVNIFKEQFRKTFAAYFPSDTIVVPIPLSKERLRERAFNQAQTLASFLPVKIDSVLERVHSEKQSKKSRVERLNTKSPFKMTKTIEKTVILVDDLYTTGITLRHAAALLKANGCPKVYAYTLIRA